MRKTLIALALASACLGQKRIELELRSRVEAFKGSGEWSEVHLRGELVVPRTGVLICDMWDNHWCKGAARRVNALAEVMEPVLERARAAGMQIIHAPSDVMNFYKDAPERRKILAIPLATLPAERGLSDPPLPVDSSAGGCDTADSFYKAWTREHAGLRIAPEDVISDNGREIYSFLRERGIDTLLVMGVHTNMCVLNRSFAIKKMTNWGIRCILVRDLTDAMYDPHARPFVSHQEGTEMVIQHIEKYWCPTVLSSQLVRALEAR